MIRRKRKIGGSENQLAELLSKTVLLRLKNRHKITKNLQNDKFFNG